jgi:trimeric autotransporter adhesin
MNRQRHKPSKLKSIVAQQWKNRTKRFFVWMLLGWSLIIFNIGFFPQVASANLAIAAATPTQSDLKTALEGNTAVSNVSINASSISVAQGSTTGQAVTFAGGLTGGIGPKIGIDDGILLVTGTATTAIGVNNSFARSSGNEAGPTDSDLATVDSGSQNDTVALNFQVTPAGNFMALDFVFASEEYKEFVCSQFNDALGIFVSGPGITGKANIARVGTSLTPISINQINRGAAGSSADGTACNLSNSAFYVNNVDPSNAETSFTANNPSNAFTKANFTNTEYDGFTVPLTAQLKVQPGGLYTVKVVVADIGDSLWDSAVFIDGIRSYVLDFGDAPNSYGTTVVDQSIPLPGPARHSTGQDIYMGVVAPDGENTVTPATLPNAANNDDITGTDDEDAFSGDLNVTPGVTTYSLSNIAVHNGTGKSAKLMGWIDFNKNGNFLDAGEKAEVAVINGATSANLSWSGFAAPTVGTSYARFRITTDTNITNNPSPLGLAFDGEVEDYRVLISNAAASVSGNIFEDINYGGGSGRSKASSSGAAINGAVVELYKESSAGSGSYTYVSNQSTSSGAYSFTSLSAANYRVRVVNNSTNRVASTRTGDGSTVFGVQTYRTNGTSGSIVDVTDEVGGKTPSATADAASVTTAGTAFPTTALNYADIKVGTGALSGVDFGFNFDTIVNTNDTGLGSLRQFVTNSNVLQNNLLAQVNQTALTEVSIFMIPGASSLTVGTPTTTAVPGIRAGVSNQLTNGVAVITLASALPTISDSNTVIDGATQTTNVGNTNAGTLGTGGTVGTDAIALPLFNRPEIEINGGQGVVTATGAADEIKNIAANVHLDVSGANSLVQDNLVGMKADGSIVTALNSSAYGVRAGSGTNITVRHNFVRLDGSGIRTDGSGAGLLIEFNEVDAPPSDQTNTFKGILLIGGGNGYTVRNNLVKNMRGAGTELSFGGVLTNTLLENNTYLHNGYLTPGGTTPSTEAMGIVSYGAGAGARITLSKNIVTQSGGPGIVVMSSQGVTITRNSTFANGVNGAGLGIDLDPVARDPNSYGAANGVTANNGTVSPTLPNNDLDYPIINSANLSSGTLTVKGFVGSVSTGSSTFGTTTLEFFIADDTPANQNGEVISGDGKSLPHGEGKTYIGTCSADANGLFDCSFTNAGTVGLTNAANITATARDSNGNTSEFSAPPSVNNPNVLLVKRITAVNGSATNGSISLSIYDPETDTNNPSYAYDKNITQTGLTPPSSTNWPNTTGATSSTFLLGARSGGTTKAGDEIDYTIYFLSTGGASAKNVTICDRIPSHQTFVPDSFNSLTAAPNATPVLPIGDRGIEVSQGSTIYGYTNIGDGDAARYYPPGSPLPSACTQTGSTEDNGTVVVNLGDVPNATAPGSPVDSYGFLRFRARVK